RPPWISIISVSLFELDLRHRHHPRPALYVFAHRLAETGGTVTRDVGVPRRHHALKVRVREDLPEFGVEAGNDARGRAFGRHDADPHRRIDALEAGFVERRYIG